MLPSRARIGSKLWQTPWIKQIHPPSPEGRTLYCFRFSSRFWDLGILPHISNVQSAHQASHQVSPPPCAAAEPRMAWSTRTTRKRRTRTMSRCTTLRAAAPYCQCSRQLPLQPPGCTTLRASVRFTCPEARRPTLRRADLSRQPQAPDRLRRVSVTWRRRCLPRERHLVTKLQSRSVP